MKPMCVRRKDVKLINIHLAGTLIDGVNMENLKLFVC